MATRVFPQRRSTQLYGTQQLATAPAAQRTFIPWAFSPLTVYGNAPEIRLEETDQTDPAGRYRLGGTAGDFVMERKEASGDWPALGTDLYFLLLDWDSKRYYITIPGTDWQLKMGRDSTGAMITLGTQGSGAGVCSVETPNATYAGMLTRLTIQGGVGQGSGYVTSNEPITGGGVDDLTLRANQLVTNATAMKIVLQTLNTAGDAWVTVAQAVPTATETTPFLAIRGAITTPLTSTLPSNFWTIAYTLGGAAVLWVNDNGTIRSLSLGTPA